MNEDDEVVTRGIVREVLREERVVTEGKLDAAVAKLATKDELAAAVAKLATKEELNAAVAKLATKEELNAWVLATHQRFNRLEAKVDAIPTELARHIDAAFERFHAESRAIQEPVAAHIDKVANDQAALRTDFEAHRDDTAIHARRKRK